MSDPDSEKCLALARAVVSASVEIDALVDREVEAPDILIRTLEQQLAIDLSSLAALAPMAPPELAPAVHALRAALGALTPCYRSVGADGVERAVEDLCVAIGADGAEAFRATREARRAERDARRREAIRELHRLSCAMLDALPAMSLEGVHARPASKQILHDATMRLTIDRLLLDDDHPANAASFEVAHLLLRVTADDAERLEPSAWAALPGALRILRDAVAPREPLH